MDKEALRAQLAKFRDQVNDAHTAAPDARGSAHEALGELDRLIAEDTAPPSMAERLETLAVRFEADHPALAAGARRLLDLLGEVGI